MLFFITWYCWFSWHELLAATSPLPVEVSDGQIKQQQQTIIKVMERAEELISNGSILNTIQQEQKLLPTSVEKNDLYQVNATKALGSNFTKIEKLASGKQTLERKQSQLTVFVSLSMPAAQLRLLVSEAKKYQAVILLRGLDGDVPSTIKKLSKILGDTGGVAINPLSFSEFNITAVPSFVYQQANSSSFIKAQGSVTISYFLEQAGKHHAHD